MVTGTRLPLPLVAEAQFVAVFDGRISIMPALGQLGCQDHARDLGPIPHFLGAQVATGHEPDKQAADQCQREPDEREIPMPGPVGRGIMPVRWRFLHAACYGSDRAAMPLEIRTFVRFSRRPDGRSVAIRAGRPFHLIPKFGFFRVDRSFSELISSP